MKLLAPFLLALVACHGGSSHDTPDAPPAGGDSGSPDGATGCAPGLAGAPCVIDLYDQAKAACDAALVGKLQTELDARAGLGPLWAGGRALFRTNEPAHVAGTFNSWAADADATAPFCGSAMNLAIVSVPTGFHTYKLVTGTTWSVDAQNPAFAYDDYAGNADHQNSVLNTPDSGRGHLVALDRVCSTTLGNCRNVTAYLPPGYDAPAAASTTYPVLFMHDGQNVWDNHTCCFGHTGWEINVQLDADIAAKHVAPVIVIAVDNTVARNNEYGLDHATMMSFIDFQVSVLQPKELARVRHDGKKVFIAGSSLGGLVSMELALRHPDVYAGAASLSGAFWPGMDTGTALRDELAGFGKQSLAIYVDSGGDPADDSDGAADTIEVRDRLLGMGWQRGDSPACTPGPDAVCYYWEPGATHDELAWKARSWRFLRYLFPGQ